MVVKNKVAAKFNEQVHLRVFSMPCCGHVMCWINPRLPNFCPECGSIVYTRLLHGEHTKSEDKEAWMRYAVPESA